MTFAEFVDIVLVRLSQHDEPREYVQLAELTADLDVPWQWAGQVAKLLEYRLFAECVYSAHGTSYASLTDAGRERARSLDPDRGGLLSLERSVRLG
jgi:hypothetical protein